MSTKIREHDGFGMGADEVPYFLPQAIADMDESLEFEIVVVASKTCGPDEKDAVQKEATRRLRVALAATELRAACEHASVSCHHPACTAPANAGHRCTCHVEKARLALAKAKGE